mmetsp:Transcript_2093/g.3006  ORF Transcript_2093/g.3006 Transcript_2093/m.3006 type:complete len:309 (-) Transcript_2093:512-1438(-)
MTEYKPKYQLGFFPEGGWFDIVDKSFSKPIFTVELGKLEYLLCVPGVWFGLPPAVWGVIPLYVAMYQASLENVQVVSFACYFGAPATLLLLIYWFQCIAENRVRDVYLATKKLFPVLVFGPPLVTKLTLPEGYSSTCFVVSAWCAGEILCHFIKVTSRRMRPIICLDVLKDVHRELPSLLTILREGETAFQSFPSGDAVGGAVVSTTIFLLNPQLSPTLYYLPALICCFGRMYYHAHHLSDVIFGSLLGFLTTVALHSVLGLASFTWIHVLLSILAFIISIRISAKLIPFEIPTQYRRGTSIYGRKHE